MSRQADAGTGEAVRRYIDAIRPGHRPLFDRVHRLVLEVCPRAELRLSYGMPTFVSGSGRLIVGAWKHGLSVYGWDEGRDGGFLRRHPDLANDKGTIRLTVDAARSVTDDDLSELIRAVLPS